jgi:tetratricopeptide (TPR) repeat protein
MTKFAIILAAFITALFFPNLNTDDLNNAYDVNAVKTKASVSCTPDRQYIFQLLEESEEISLMPGSGSYVWKINTRSDSAQLYFNQGINMYYGFHIIEALASFRKAAKFDESNPMTWWALALALGPNINDVEYNAAPEALASSRKALQLSTGASAVEKALINAMSVRYSDDTTKSRESLNQAYVDAMKDAYNKFPNNVDVMALYADAMMLQHPWDLWAVDGVPKPWQPGIQEVVEKTLKVDPMHPGANHYYIHIMEASPTPEKALRSANVLGKITPGLSHLVHMPSHIYLRTGDLERGISNNEEAVGRFREYSILFPASAGHAFIYYWHNLHMLANCALLAGRYREAIASANELRVALDTASLASPAPMGSFLYYMYMTPQLVNVRFEKWDSILSSQKPAEKYVYANVLDRFARGMAYAAKNQFSEAEKAAAEMEVLMRDENLKIPMLPFSPVSDGSVVAYETLNGFIALKNNKTEDAIEHFKLAAEKEWQMVYTEPRDWILNPFTYLGSAYLAAKNYPEAEKAFRKDLTRNAKNVWSLNGLEKSLRMQGKKKEAAKVKAELKKAASKADSEIVVR